MTRANLGGTLLRGAVLAALAVLSVGCADQDQIKKLNQEKDELIKQNADYQTRIAALEAAQTQRSPQDAQEIARLQNDLAAAKAAKAGQGSSAAGQGEWEVGLSGDRVTLGSDVLFSAGRADLTADGKKSLDKIAGDIKSRYAGLPVRVYGYTDTDPIVKTKKLWADNLDLSLNRSAAVTRYLIGKGIKASMIETIGMGETHSIAGNKAKSRRVEIIVVKKPGA